MNSKFTKTAVIFMTVTTVFSFSYPASAIIMDDSDASTTHKVKTVETHDDNNNKSIKTKSQSKSDKTNKSKTKTNTKENNDKVKETTKQNTEKKTAPVNDMLSAVKKTAEKIQKDIKTTTTNATKQIKEISLKITKKQNTPAKQSSTSNHLTHVKTKINSIKLALKKVSLHSNSVSFNRAGSDNIGHYLGTEHVYFDNETADTKVTIQTGSADPVTLEIGTSANNQLTVIDDPNVYCSTVNTDEHLCKFWDKTQDGWVWVRVDSSNKITELWIDENAGNRQRFSVHTGTTKSLGAKNPLDLTSATLASNDSDPTSYTSASLNPNTTIIADLDTNVDNSKTLEDLLSTITTYAKNTGEQQSGIDCTVAGTCADTTSADFHRPANTVIVTHNNDIRTIYFVQTHWNGNKQYYTYEAIAHTDAGTSICATFENYGNFKQVCVDADGNITASGNRSDFVKITK
jgi:hypothetical protein